MNKDDVLVLAATFTLIGLRRHHKRHGDVSSVVGTPRSPVPVSLHLLSTAQAKLARFVTAGAATRHTIPFGFTARDATGA